MAEIGIVSCGNNSRASNGIEIPSSTPARPPSVLMQIASARNCARICLRVAPTDKRIPISLVRSVTEISMMFMMKIPLMVKVTAATRMRTTVSAKAISFVADKMDERFSTL